MKSGKGINTYENFMSDYPIQESFNNIKLGIDTNREASMFNEKYPRFVKCTNDNAIKCDDILIQKNQIDKTRNEVKITNQTAGIAYDTCDRTERSCNALDNDIDITKTAFDLLHSTVSDQGKGLTECNRKETDCNNLNTDVKDTEARYQTIKNTDMNTVYSDCYNRTLSKFPRFSRYFGKKVARKYCGQMKTNRIAQQKRQLGDLSTQLSAIKKNGVLCNQWIKKNCPSDMQTSYDETMEKYSRKRNELDKKQTQFTSNCTNLQDCGLLKQKSDQLQQQYSSLVEQGEHYQTRHNICTDPTLNDCRDDYLYMKESQLAISANVDALVQEGFDEDNSLRELIDMNNTNTDMRNTLKYTKKMLSKDILDKGAMKKEKHYHRDQTIYTNILLTTAATTLLFFLFTRIK